MRAGLYTRLALDGIRRNRQTYLPYMLACGGTVGMHYVVSFIHHSKTVASMRGGAMFCSLMELGEWILAVFACIFLFYTNSFLMRRRRREFGLYNVLGMGKPHIGRILLYETVITAVLSVASGLFVGILISKLAELAVVRMAGAEATFDFTVSAESVLTTAAVFSGIFLLLYLKSLAGLRFAGAAELLKSEAAGEKPPKANYFLGILGVVVLGVAYYIAVTVKNPIEAMAWFFVAVVMVIIATYMIMISGSVALCRILRKNKSRYYSPRHFIPISSMAYRMKRNGAGLASICILSTMALVMISSTTCLYYGAEDAFRAQYPFEIETTVVFKNPAQASGGNIERLRSRISETAADFGVQPENIKDFRFASITGSEHGVAGDFKCSYNRSDYGSARFIVFIPQDDWNNLCGESVSLAENEAAVVTVGFKLESSTVSFEGVCPLDIVSLRSERKTPIPGLEYSVANKAVIIVKDLDVIDKVFTSVYEAIGSDYRSYVWKYGFDTELDGSTQRKLAWNISGNLAELDFDPGKESEGYAQLYTDDRANARDDYFGFFAALLCLAVVLSIVFTSAAVLIIYYKQLSEGYEDSARYDIMINVGMTKEDIRKSINSQLITVFFLPLCFSGLHLTFAFPMIRRLMLLFGLSDVWLFLLTTGITFAAFAVFYISVYRVTSNTYLHIVAPKKRV